MRNTKITFRIIILLLTLAALSAVSGYVFRNKVSAAALSGRIYTTTFDGQFVPQNHYSSKDAVYLGGGPVNGGTGGPGLPDGSYYFQVTGPGGDDLLSTDPAVCRQLIVAGGIIASGDGPSCQHPTGIPTGFDGSVPIKLMPFIDTPNPGGNYKAWLIAKTSNTTVLADGIHIDFKQSDSKQEIFRADNVPCPNCSPTYSIGGVNYYDVNANAVRDQGEVAVEGVKILVVAGDTTNVVTTSASGSWSATIPTGSEYQVFQFLPFTGPSGEPGSYWEQTAPFADGEGLQRYIGTASGNLPNLNFGNRCFLLDVFRNPFVSSTPCPVSDLPAPEATPTPTPTPCDGCSTTAVLSGRKFYDGNRNGSANEGEVSIQGVQIVVVLVTSEETTTTVTTTNADGNWSMTVPVGAQYLISEYLPDTDPELEFGPYTYWEQSGPLPNDEGFRGYSGTVSENQGGFNFGNVCFHTDSQGNAILSSTPCTVRYPPPLPTPTPTPNNQ